jgi:3-dehydroquinate synthase
MKQLVVDLGERSYPIYIGRELLKDIAMYLDNHNISRQSALLVVTDEHVAQHHLSQLTDALTIHHYDVHTCIVPAGETSKSLTQLEAIISMALQSGLDRKSTIIAFGGGVVGDLAGFAAASFMRGIKFIQIPTTILAHDSSVGGKVAVNHPSAKNIIGAFHQPEMVLFDISLLHTLPLRQVKSGLAEVIKHGLIWDASFVNWCDEHVEQLLSLDDEALQYALYRGCQIKATIVSQDEKEEQLRAVLNLGHTIGHALEAVAKYNELLHGEAISIGMVAAAQLANHLGYSSEIAHTTQRIFTKFGLPTRIPAHMDSADIISAMMHDKKFKKGTMTFIIPTDIGKVEIRNDVKLELVELVIQKLKMEA